MKEKKFLHTPFIAVFIILCGFFLTGCWSGHEVDDLAIINVLGIDTNNKGEYNLIARVVKPQKLYSNSANSGGTEDYYQPVVETGQGKSIVEAMENLSQQISNRIYLGHTQVVILGESTARNHIKEVLDFLNRENHFRPNIKLLVTNGPAESVLYVKPRLETTLGSELYSFINNTKYHPTSMVTDVAHFTRAAVSDTSDPYTGVIGLENVNNHRIENSMRANQSGNSEIDKENDRAKLVLSETAVFKKNGLIGFLDAEETEGFLWVRGEVKNDFVILKCGGSDPGMISLKVSNTESHLSPKMVNGKLEIDDHIKVDADIRQMTCRKTTLTTQQLDRINKKLQNKVMSEVGLVFDKVKRDYQADIFGFGEVIYKKYPKEWKKVEPRWTQGEMRKLKVNLSVDANISNYGLIRQSK